MEEMEEEGAETIHAARPYLANGWIRSGGDRKLLYLWREFLSAWTGSDPARDGKSETGILVIFPGD